MAPVSAAPKRKIDISLYIMLVPALVLVIIYAYGPLAGLVIAFKRYDIAIGMIDSPWVGLDNFKTLLFKYPEFRKVLFNTIFISSMKLVATFAAPIIVSILLNELYHLKFKKAIQTMIYLPYFMSWVIVAGVMMDVLHPTEGIVNNVITALGFKSIYFLGEPKLFPFVAVFSDVWKGFGFGTIIYMAALTGIDPSLYEAATIDGATRFQRTRYITIPGIVPIMVLLGTLSLGYILNAGFEQIFNLYNPLVYSTADILDTFNYRIGIENSQYDMATTVGLFKSAVSIVMVSTSYYLAYKLADYRIF